MEGSALLSVNIKSNIVGRWQEFISKKKDACVGDRDHKITRTGWLNREIFERNYTGSSRTEKRGWS